MYWFKKKITQLLCDWSCYKWKDSVTPCQIISHDGDRGKFDCTVFYSAGARGQSDFDIFGCANECATIGLSIPTVCLIRNISPARWNPTPRRHPCRRLHPSHSAWRSGPGGASRVGCETDRPLCRSVFKLLPHLAGCCFHIQHLLVGANAWSGFHILD